MDIDHCLFARLLFILNQTLEPSQESAPRVIQNFGWKILTAFREKTVTTKGTVIECIANDKDYQSDSEPTDDIVVFLIAGHGTTHLYGPYLS